MAVRRTARAILIGVADYQDESAFRRVPAALNSVRGMYEVLTGPQLGGWSADEVVLIENPANAVRLVQRMRRIAEEATDVLLVYFVGHGVMTEDMELCFAVSDTEATDLDLTGVEYSKLRRVFRASAARVKIAILDCCFSGRAIESLSAPSFQLADASDIAGVYTLTAADTFAHVVPLDQQSLACTSFTGTLLDVIRAGIADGPPDITLGALYPVLRAEIAARGLPRANRRGTDTADGFVFTRNAWSSAGPVSPGTEPDPALWSSVLDEAERIAVAVGHPGARAGARAGVLADIAALRAAHDPGHARQLVAQALQAARTIRDLACQSVTLARIAAAVAAYDADESEALFDQAERTAQGCAEPPGFQGAALASVTLARAARDPERAERAASLIADPGRRARTQAGIAEIAAGQDLDRAERMARALPDAAGAGMVLAGIAAKVAAYDRDRAERALAAITQPAEQVEAMLRVAAAVAAHDPAAARRLTDDAEHIAMTGTGSAGPQSHALVAVAEAVLPGDPGRARRILDDAEHIAMTIGDPRERDRVLERLAAAVAACDVDRAVTIAGVIASPRSRAYALASAARSTAGRDPARARDLIGDAEAAVAEIGPATHRNAVLSGLAGMAGAGDPELAVRLAGQITSPQARAQALAGVAALLPAGPPARADEILRHAAEAAAQITDPVPRAAALIHIARARAGTAAPALPAAAGMPAAPVRSLPREVARLLRGQVAAARDLAYQFSGAPPAARPAFYLSRTLTGHTSGTLVAAGPEFLIKTADRASVLVLGEPGLGKTTLSFQLATMLAAGWLDGTPAHGLVPLRVGAAFLASEDGSLEQALLRAASGELGPLLDAPLAEDLLDLLPEGSRWLVLVDGLSQVREPGSRRALITRLADHASRGGGGGRFRVLTITDPLPQDEYDRLRYSGADCYDLEPFDREQIDEFLRRWFGADGTGADGTGADGTGADDTAKTLVQGIELQLHGQLAALLGVPLMAAIAAFTHGRDPRRPLPGNRHGLYQRYLGCLSRDRAPGTAQCWAGIRRRLSSSASSSAAAEEEAPLRYLHTHVADLIEHLAEQAEHGAADLLEAALAWADSHGAGPVREHLTDWPSLLSAILTSTGLLSDTGTGMRFPHQGLTRHLASTAAARRLPAAFDPRSPDWAAALHAALYRDDRAVLVQHSHLHPTGDDMLGWLESGDRHWQMTAGRLLADGARADPSHADRFMASVWHQVTIPERHTGMYWEFDYIASLGSDAALRMLRAAASDQGTTVPIRLQAARALARRDPDAGVPLLRTLSSDPAVTAARFYGEEPALELARLGATYAGEAARALQAAIGNPRLAWSGRRSAVRRLARMGAEYAADAVRVLLAAIRASGIDGYECAEAAELLVTLDPQYRPQAVQALHSALARPDQGPGEVHDLAASLARLDPTCAARAVQVMRAIIGDPDPNLDPYYRQRAAGTLYGLGPQYTTEAVQTLRTIISDNPHGYRTYAAETLHGLGPQYGGEVTRALLAAVSDPGEALHDRMSAAEMVTRLDRSTASDVAGVLRGILTDPQIPSPGKLSAAETLSTLDLQYGEQAAAAFRAIAADPACPPYERTRSIEKLTAIDPESAPWAGEILRRLIAGPAPSPARSTAARTLVQVQPQYKQEAADALRSCIADTDSYPSDRTYNATYLAGLGPPYTAEAAAALREIVADTGRAEEARWRAAEYLCSLGPGYLGDQAWAVRTFLAETDTRSRRPDAIWTLARLDPNYAADAAGELRTIISQSAGDARAGVQEWLTRLGPA